MIMIKATDAGLLKEQSP
jgi:hypothetical protein